MKQKVEDLDVALLSRFVRREKRARDNLPGVLRRIDELEDKVKAFSKPASSGGRRLTPEMAAAPPAEFEKLWEAVNANIDQQKALNKKSEWSEEQITRLEKNIDVVEENFNLVDKNFVRIEDNKEFKEECRGKLRSLKKELAEQKAASGKETTELKDYVKGELASFKYIADKSKDADHASPKNEEVQELKNQLEEHGAYIESQGARLRDLTTQNETQAKLIAQQGDTIKQQGAELAGRREEIEALNAGQKTQDAEHDKLKQLVMALAAHAGFQIDSQQFPSFGPGSGPGPSQQQQQPSQQGPSGQAPWPQGNGLWTPSPSPPGQGPHPAGDDVDIDEFDDLELDSPMVDAPEEPRLPHHVESHQPQPLPPQLPSHQPQFAQQPPQSFTAAPEDIPMGNDGPVVPNNNNGTGGVAPPTAPPAQPPIFQSGMPNANPNAFAFKGTAPAVNKPQINWGARMEIPSLDPPPELADDDDDDGRPAPASAKMPPSTAAPTTPQVGQPAPSNAAPFSRPHGQLALPNAALFNPAAIQPAPLDAAPFNPPTGRPTAEVRSPANNGASPATNFNGGSASNAPPAPVANNGGPSSATVGSPSAADKPTPKAKPAQKKKPSLFMPRKPAANPGKPASVTSKAQTTQTAAASWAQKRQEAFRAGQMPEPEQTPSPAPKAPMATMKPADDESAEWMKELDGKPNPSPFATKPKPTTKPSTPLYGTSSSSTHDTVESEDPGNIFLKDIIEEPQPEPEPKPEPTRVHEPELNPRKHTGQYRAPTVEDEDDAMMDDGRKVLRPKGRAKKIPTDKAKAIIEEQNVEQSFGMWDMAWAASKAAQAPKSPSPEGEEPRTSKMTGGQFRENNGGATDQGVPDEALDREHAQKVVRVTRPDEPRLTAKPKGRMGKITPEQMQALKDADAKVAAEYEEDRKPIQEAGRNLANARASQNEPRRTAKPKGRMGNMTTEQLEAHKAAAARQAADYAEDRRKVQEAERKLEEALAAQDDVVDYGDPDDMNDEDTFITVMLPRPPRRSSLPSTRPPISSTGRSKPAPPPRAMPTRPSPTSSSQRGSPRSGSRHWSTSALRSGPWTNSPPRPASITVQTGTPRPRWRSSWATGSCSSLWTPWQRLARPLTGTCQSPSRPRFTPTSGTPGRGISATLPLTSRRHAILHVAVTYTITATTTPSSMAARSHPGHLTTSHQPSITTQQHESHIHIHTPTDILSPHRHFIPPPAHSRPPCDPATSSIAWPGCLSWTLATGPAPAGCSL